MSKTLDKTTGQFSTDHPQKSSDSDALVHQITEGLLEKKGKEIKVLNVSELTTLTDYFVVCHGTSDTQIRALANSVLDKVKQSTGENAWQQEGMDARNWIIIDYVNVVVHILTEEKRDYYGIERMWNDAAVTEVSEN